MKIKCKRLLSAVLSCTLAMCSVCVYADSSTSAPVTISVGKTSDCDFTSIQAAINSIKGMPMDRSRATIKIAPGVYNEEITVDKPYISFVNSGKAEVVITYDKANGHTDQSKNFGTDKTATVTVNENATGFTAKDITFVNSYNIDEPDNDVRKQTQAVALETLADKVVLENCRMIGRQDTLYLKGASKGQTVYGSANNARVYIKDSYIEGTVDFIFGDATAYFDNCDLKLMNYKNGGHFTAPNTTLFNVGYVFNNCRLAVDDSYTEDMASKIDLGRPWQCDAAYPNSGSNSVFINCALPDIMKSEGFSTWDETTMVSKMRFYEYGSTDSTGHILDLSKRADFVRVLTAEQAESFNAYNVLKGSDGWNPASDKGSTGICDVTLNSYDISVPQGETYELKAIALPMENKGTIEYSSADENIAKIDEKGIITGVKTGSTRVYAAAENGMSAYADVNVTAPRTAFPEIASLGLGNESKAVVGQTLKAEYSYKLASDNSIDAAKIRWYAVKGNDKIIIKEGTGDFYKSYELTKQDIGYKIMIEVFPATVTTYGEYGTPASYTTADAVTAKGNETGPLYRNGFDKGTEGWTADGPWNKLDNGYNSFIAAGCPDDSTCTLVYDNGGWDNIKFEGRFRFNPEKKGLASTGFYNIYINYNKETDSGYMVKLGRGSNTKSIILYLCKVVNGVETVLAKDDTSLKGNIYQNSGEDNPYFSVTLSKENGKISTSFFIEGTKKAFATLTAEDSEPLTAGTIALRAGGDEDVVMADSISIVNTADDDKAAKIKLYLMGDSTAKYYGDDNTIGGWGEYLINYLDSDVELINKAEGGRSARSYLNQGRLKEVLNEVNPGDYVFIQFGTNDQRTDDAAFLEHSVVLGEPDANGIYPSMAATLTKTPEKLYNSYKNTEYPYGEMFYPYESGTFKWYMKQHVDAIKKSGAIPVLLTPMCRIFFDSEGKITPHFGEKDGYITAVKQLAEEENILCLDMFDITKALYEQYGILTTQGLHNIKEDGTVDLTHYNKFGANLIASKMADVIKDSGLTIGNHIVASDIAVDRTQSLKTADLFILGGTSASGDDNTDYAVNAGGYGDYIQKYISDKVTVKNLAVTGATAKSYANTDEYKKYIEELSEGDYVIINFGSNDGDDFASENEYYNYSYPSSDINASNSFAYYIYNNYIKPAEEKKAVIILLTPAAERSFENGEYKEKDNPYVQNVIDIVKSKSYFYVNLNDVTKNLYTTMGEEGSKVLNAIDRNKGISAEVLSEFGAETVAKRILTMLQSSSSSLKDYINKDAIEAKTVMTRAEFVTMAMDIIDKSEKTDNNFADVAKGKPYEMPIAAAKNMGIVKAKDTKNNFDPEGKLTGDFAKSVIENIMIYKGSKADMTDVYDLLKGDVSYEIGIYAVDRLYEVLK